MSASWAVVSLPYFAYIAVAAVLVPGLRWRGRLRAIFIAAVALELTVLASRADAFWLRLVVAPPLVLILGYYASGALWTGPMPAIERFLAACDRALRVKEIASRLPHQVIVILELAYAGVYPLIPIALAVHLWFSPSADANRFWTVILVTDYICFAALPWIQTRPPRAIETEGPWSHGLRSFNLAFLSRASHGVNTVPSGHAAEALAAALLASDAPLPVAAAMWTAAMAISAGAVFGRYHYAVDAIAGWLVAVAVFLAV